MSIECDDGDRWNWIEQRLCELRNRDAFRKLVPRDSFTGGGRLHLVDGQQSLVNFSTNDYLGLGDERAKFVTAPVCGSGASPLVSGFSGVHARLTQQIAGLEHTASAVLLPTGYAANLAVLATLPEAGDLILSDALNHASIIDGCRLSHAERFVYPHSDAAAVRALLKTHRHRFLRAFLVTESLFSMDGDVAPLAEYVELAAEFDVVLIVDEAHATGVFGNKGGGLCEELELESHVPIRVGTLSKAVGAMGGFVAGPQPVIDYLVNRARPFIFSTAFPEAIAQVACDHLQILQAEPQRRTRLHMLSKRLTSAIEKVHPLRGKLHPGSPIVPLIVGENAKAIQCAALLKKAGFLVPAIRPPTVPEKTARLRISLSSGHSDQEVERLIKILAQLP